MERSYYVATANPFAPAPKLEGEAAADVVVIGGGYTGLHAALNAAERGYSVILLEAGRIGWGASGRNGGQLIPGWRKSATELIARYGEAKARLLFGLALEARTGTLERIVRHDISCDLRLNGCLTLAAQVSGRTVDTIEGMSESGKLADLQNEFIVRNAAQCGFCSSGMLLTAYELICSGEKLSRTEIREVMSGNMCRCTGYHAIIDAVEAVMARGAR